MTQAEQPNSSPQLQLQAENFIRLAKSNRREAEDTFAVLALEEKRAIVLAADPVERVSLLYLAEDVAELVQSLPERELYASVQAVGKWETQELIEAASPEQINFFLDQECWRGENLDSRSTMEWMQLFLSADDDDIIRLLTTINADLLALVLKKHVKFDRDFMIQDTYYLDPGWVTGSNTTVRHFLERLYSLDPNLWIRLLAWVRTHSRATIEADAIEGRESRLSGHGYPAPTLAITIYYPVAFDVDALIASWQEQFSGSTTASITTTTAIETRRQRSFLQDVLQHLGHNDDAATTAGFRLEAELAEIANKVMIADQIDTGNAKRRRECMDKVRRWINIGLEVQCNSDVTTAALQVRTLKLEYFFRLGAMLFDALANAVLTLQKAEHAASGCLVTTELAALYLPLLEPEPHIPDKSRSSAGTVIASLSEYRYAWELVWLLSNVVDNEIEQL